MKITRHTTYTVEIDGHDFEIPFEFDEGSETLKISDDGQTARLGVLRRDDNADDPFEVFGEGEYYQFDRSYIHDTARPDLADFKRLIRANPGRLFTTSFSGNIHGAGTVDIHVVDGPLTAKDTRGEDCPAADALDAAHGYYIAPEDATDPKAYAEAALQQYSEWCRGEVYGVCVWTYALAEDDSWELTDRDECWGFYGTDYAEQELKSQMED